MIRRTIPVAPLAVLLAFVAALALALVCFHLSSGGSGRWTVDGQKKTVAGPPSLSSAHRPPSTANSPSTAEGGR
jgi:hypothetical protein